ncbi:MAG: RIP metalloprotease RseP [Myxococcota bacterium]
MALIDTLAAFVPLLGVLIFIHELGHFLVAKACGVRVLTFSLGFGSPIGFGRHRLRWERGGTEYVVAWIPLGGYVKMLGENLAVQGEDPEPEVLDARPDEFLSAKPVWQKLAISFAGPAMNLAFPVAVLVVGLWLGMPRAAAVVGTVDPGSPAAEAGLRAGDRIVAIDGSETRYWDDVEEAVRAARGGALRVEAERDGAQLAVQVPVVVQNGLDEIGRAEPRGWIGIQNEKLQPLVGVPGARSPAALAGLRSGDLVVRVGDEEIGDWNALVAAFDARAGAAVEVAVRRGDGASGGAGSGGASAAPIAIALPASQGLAALGVVPASVLVAEVEAGSAAEEAGLARGDLLLELDGRPIGTFLSFAESVRSSQGRALALTYAREGDVRATTVTPRLVQRDTGLAHMKEDVYQVGVRSFPVMLPGETTIERHANPLVALPRASAMAWDITKVFLKGLGHMLSGGAGMDSLAGPIGIAQISRQSLDLGWWAYFQMMMLISINLGILNLLPIPVLDGGQALIYSIEGIKRSPLSLRTREIVQGFGLVMVLLLMGVAIGNDILRNWSSFFDWIRG